MKFPAGFKVFITLMVLFVLGVIVVTFIQKNRQVEKAHEDFALTMDTSVVKSCDTVSFFHVSIGDYDCVVGKWVIGEDTLLGGYFYKDSIWREMNEKEVQFLLQKVP